MVKELHMSMEDGDMRKVSVRTDPTNDNSACIKQKSSFWTILKTFYMFYVQGSRLPRV